MVSKSEEDCCGENTECNCCEHGNIGQDETGNDCTESCCGSYADVLIGIAHDAKTELLVEKLKVKLEAKFGKQLDKLADLLVEAMEIKMKEENDAEKMAELNRKITETLME